MNAAKQTRLLEEVTQRVRDSHIISTRALEAWTAHASRTAVQEDPELEALRAEWQRARDTYVSMLEAFFLVASGALSDVEDNEARLTATKKLYELLGGHS